MSAIACPACGRRNDCHPEATGFGTPEAGDVAICWGCRQVIVYDRDALGVLIQRRPTPEEPAEIDADPRVARAQAVLAVAAYPEQAIDALRGSS